MTSLLPSLAGGFASGLAANLFTSGGNVTAPLQRGNQIPSFDFGGLSGRNQGGSLAITPSEGRLGLVGGVQRSLANTADAFGQLRSQVSPGFGALTSARLGSLQDARERTIGTIRENLARRRLQGSSFANDALARAEREFGREEADLRARSFLEELEVTQNLINRELELNVGAIERGIAELDLQADVGTQLLAGITTNLGAAARLEAELAAQSVAGAGAFFKPAIQGIGTATSDFFTDLLG